MSAPPLTAIVLAAGLGKRMKSALPKALIPVAGKPMVIKVIEALKAASVERIVVVIGHKGKDVESAILNAGFNDVIFSLQKLQLGTGDAAKEGLKKIPGDADNILILPADVPLISADYISDLFQNHTKSCADVTLLTTTLMDPAGYGRIIRDRNGNLTSIKEDKDCTEAEKAIKEVNVGIYCFKYAFLREALKNLSTDNAQKEYYITDTIHAAFEKGLKVEAINIPNPSKLLGANTRFELFALERIVMEERIKEIMENGGSVPFPQTVLIEEGVTVGDRVSIGGNVQLLGETVIEDDVTIEGCAIIIDSIIKKGARLKLGVRIEKSEVGESASVGPFCHLRPGASLSKDVRVGNFVEVKNSSLGTGTKAGHLTYIGDAEVGEGVNFGAGTITANYDGFRKHKTTIKNGASTGSNSVLVAPVTIGKNAYIGACSAITKDVSDGALAIARPKQVEIKGWFQRRIEQETKDQNKKDA